MAISARAAGTWAYAASGSVTSTLPTHVAGDMLLVRVAYKSSAISTCNASTATSGWALVRRQSGGTTNSGNGTGSVAISIFWKEAASASETNPTIDFSEVVTQVGHVAVSYQKGAGETWATPAAGGVAFAATTSVNQQSTGGSLNANGTIAAGDMVDATIATQDDSAITVPTFTCTGVTFGTVAEYPTTAGLDASGADGSYDGCYRLATAGSNSAGGPTMTATIAASESGTIQQTCLRVVAAAPTNPPYTSPYPPLIAQ